VSLHERSDQLTVDEELRKGFGTRNWGVHASDTSEGLLLRLKEVSDDKSWFEFYYIYWGLIFRTARKYGLSETAAEDVAQDTLIAVSRNIRHLNYDREKGSFKCWLMNQTRWKALDYLKRQTRNVWSDVEGPVSFSADVFEKRWEEDWRRALVEMAFEQLKETMSPIALQIFHLRVFGGRSVMETARLLDVSIATVYLSFFRMQRRCKEQVAKLKAEGF
jgi:RNA polymerase sigma factor (sigma-70 family)